jgi:hypothetical protein
MHHIPELWQAEAIDHCSFCRFAIVGAVATQRTHICPYHVPLQHISLHNTFFAVAVKNSPNKMFDG